jgi:hypothetical protein
MAQDARHKKPSHANVKHAGLASHDVNVVKPLSHCASLLRDVIPNGAEGPVRNLLFASATTTLATAQDTRFLARFQRASE